jgi:hypothetical protein
VLEYISGAPNKEIVIEDEPNIFDYDQLTKYGFDVSDDILCRKMSWSISVRGSHAYVCVVSRDTNHECRWTTRNVQTYGYGIACNQGEEEKEGTPTQD